MTDASQIDTHAKKNYPNKNKSQHASQISKMEGKSTIFRGDGQK